MINQDADSNNWFVEFVDFPPDAINKSFILNLSTLLNEIITVYANDNNVFNLFNVEEFYDFFTKEHLKALDRLINNIH